jgi:hypothetical protein
MRLTYATFNERRELRQEPAMNLYTGLLFLHGHILRSDDLVPPPPAGPVATGDEAPLPVTALERPAIAIS